MRKTTLSRSLLLTAALTLGATTMTAQTVSPTPVGSPDELTDGYYIIKATPNNNEFSGLVYYNLNDGANRHFRVDQDKQAYDNGTLETAYIWRLTKSEDGTFSLMGMHDNKFIPADASANQNFRGTETANLQITVGEGEQAGNWYVTMTNYQHSNQDTYWYNNKPDGDPNLSWWQNYTGGGAMKVEFYAISDLPETVNVTYNAKYTGDGRNIGTANYELFIGDTYPTPELSNIPAYVTVGDLPEGTVSAEQTIDIDCTWEGPFAISESVQNATWYAVGLHTAPYYLHNTKGAESMTLAAEQQTIDASTIEAFDAQMWCFVGNPFDGFKIYNKAAGEGMILSSSTTMSGNNGGSTYPILMDEASLPEGNNTTWDITASTNISGINGFYIAQHGITANKMNLRDGKLAYWSSGVDAGSTFRVLNLQALYNAELGSLVSASQSHQGYVGALKSEIIEQYQSTIDALTAGTSSPEAYVTLYNAFNKPENTIALTDGGYYRLHCAPVRGNFVLAVDAENMGLKSAAPSTSDASQIWKAVRTDDGKYKLMAQGYAIGGDNSLSLVDEAEAATFYFGKNLTTDSNGDPNLIWFFDTTHAESNNDKASGSTALNVDQSLNITLLPNRYGASAWLVEEVKTLDVTMNTVGDETWATLYLPFSVTTPEGVTAYTGTQKDENTVGLTDVKDGIIPAQTGVVLKGTATTCPLTLTNDAVAPVEGNIFTGTCLPISVTPETLENYYVLSTLQGVIGLYWPQEGTTALAANKAYIDNTPAAGAAGYRFVFGDDTTVGINGAQFGQPSDAPYYDLSGRRVAQPAKGIYIHNGKKVFIK